MKLEKIGEKVKTRKKSINRSQKHLKVSVLKVKLQKGVNLKLWKLKKMMKKLPKLPNKNLNALLQKSPVAKTRKSRVQK